MFAEHCAGCNKGIKNYETWSLFSTCSGDKMMCEKYSFNMVGFHTVQNEFKASGGGGAVRTDGLVHSLPYCLLFPVLSDALFVSFIEFFSSRKFFFFFVVLISSIKCSFG